MATAGKVHPAGYSALESDDIVLSHFNYMTKAVQNPIDEQGRDWTQPCSGCLSDIPTCCLTYCCGCVSHGMNVSRIKENNNATCVFDSALFCIANLIGLQGCLGAVYRDKIRKKAGIKGNIYHDLCLHTFCTVCAIVQEKQELDKLYPSAPKPTPPMATAPAPEKTEPAPPQPASS